MCSNRRFSQDTAVYSYDSVLASQRFLLPHSVQLSVAQTRMTTNYSVLNVPTLRSLLKDRNLVSGGNKPVLIARLEQDDATRCQVPPPPQPVTGAVTPRHATSSTTASTSQGSVPLLLLSYRYVLIVEVRSATKKEGKACESRAQCYSAGGHSNSFVRPFFDLLNVIVT